MNQNTTSQEISNHQQSIWINANAGSGKTTALINRIIALLINNNPIQSIIAITYTNNAANEITNRLTKQLFSFTKMQNKELQNTLHNIVGKTNNTTLNQAKTLYNKLIWQEDKPQIFTIHSLCYKILRQNRKEQGKTAPAIALSNTINYKAKQFVIDVTRDFIKSQLSNITKQGNNSHTANPINTFLSLTSNRNLKKLIHQIIHENITNPFQGITQNHNLNNIYAAINKDTTTETLKQIAFGHVNKVQICLDSLLKYQSTSKTIAKITTPLQNWSNQYTTIPTNTIKAQSSISELTNIFCTKKLQPRQITKGGIQSQDIETFSYIAHVLIKYKRLRNSKTIMQANIFFAEIAKIATCAYQQFMQYNNAIDGNQLLSETLSLLQGNNNGPIKKDFSSNISHILIDEAQDVSPISWDIIFELSESFFQQNYKTFFIVGDDKQSIFGFQGANVKNIKYIKQKLFSKMQEAKKQIVTINLNLSYRTDQSILNYIDQLFNHKTFLNAITSQSNIKHHSARNTDTGDIIVYNTTHHIHNPSEDKEQNEDNTKQNTKAQYGTTINNHALINTPSAMQSLQGSKGNSPNQTRKIKPLDQSVNTHNNIPDWQTKPKKNKHNPALDQEIQFICNTIIQWHKEGIKLEEIMVLVRNRGSKNNIVLKLIKTLKDRGMQANIDKFTIQHHIIFQDFIALYKFILYPHNQANLIAVLRSVFCNLTIQEIDAMLTNEDYINNNTTPINILKQYNKTLYNKLNSWIKINQSQGVAKLTINLLYKHKVANIILHKHGQDALNIAEKIAELTYLSNGQPITVTNLLQQMNSGNIHCTTTSKTGITISTIHSAKGSEYDAVILWDTTSIKDKPREQIISADISWLIPNIQPIHEELEKLIQENKEAKENEEKRLLYVALTRARHKLCIVGQTNSSDWIHIMQHNTPCNSTPNNK